MNYLTPIFLTLLSTFALTACAQTVEDPKIIADKYWQYLQTGNTVEAEKLLSTNSLSIFSEHTSRINENTKIDNSAAKTLVSTTITSINPETGQSHVENFNTVLVLENGQWKIDIRQSPIPPIVVSQEEKAQQLKEQLSESIQENIESLDNAMSEGMQMLNEALRDGSKEMGTSLQQLMNELNNTMQESIDKMQQRREQLKQEQQRPQPDPEKDEGMI